MTKKKVKKKVKDLEAGNDLRAEEIQSLFHHDKCVKNMECEIAELRLKNRLLQTQLNMKERHIRVAEDALKFKEVKEQNNAEFTARVLRHAVENPVDL